MSCTNPLKGFKYGKTKTGKDNYIICSYKVDHIEVQKNNNIVKCYSRGISSNCKVAIKEFIEIPCGKCLGCRLDYSRQWAVRCMLEMQQHENNCFITLTYDDLHVPVIDNDGTPELSLMKSDLQKFFKRLRRFLGEKKIRYFACGEYGDHTFRPHYHIMLFGWIPDDLQLLKKSDMGYDYYISEILSDIWSVSDSSICNGKKLPIGNVLVTNATYETAAYTARYVAKKAEFDINYICDSRYIEREFIVMSRKPGIGFDWLSSTGIQPDNVCYATFLENYVSTENGSKSFSNIRYFDKKFDELLEFDSDNELAILYKNNKENRKELAELRKKSELESSSLPYLDYLEVKKENLKKKTKVLERKAI